jgi:tetratricopeptide (TPR) repeat protein
MSLRAQAQWRDFDRARSLYAQAEDEVHHRHLPEAIEHLEQVIHLCPDYLAAWDLLAHCYLLSKQPDRAIEVLQEACRVHPGISQFRTTLGLVYVRLEQPEKAIEQFDAAMKLDPIDPMPARLKQSLSKPAQSSVKGPEDGQHGESDQKAEHAQ